LQWTVYDLDASVTSLSAATTVGSLGGSYPGVPVYAYHSPCSAGGGYKTYHFRLLAISDSISNILATVDDDESTVGPYLEDILVNGGYVLLNTTMDALADTADSLVDPDADVDYVNDDDANLCYGR
jgi:hypothetical protein